MRSASLISLHVCCSPAPSADGVRCREHGSARVEDGGDAGLRDGDGLLLHRLVDGHAILNTHTKHTQSTHTQHQRTCTHESNEQVRQANEPSPSTRRRARHWMAQPRRCQGPVYSRSWVELHANQQLTRAEMQCMRVCLACSLILSNSSMHTRPPSASTSAPPSRWNCTGGHKSTNTAATW